MATIHELLRWLHVGAGFIALAAFWLPVFLPKGQRWHMRAGRFFVRAAYVVTSTAIMTATLRLAMPLTVEPLPPGTPADVVARVVGESRMIGIFLLYLGVVTLAGLHHGLSVLYARRRGVSIRTPVHTALNALAVAGSIAVIAVGAAMRQPILLALSPIGILGGISALRYARQIDHSSMSWWYEHMGGMLGTGIAFHTAFFVFGAARLFDLGLDGLVAVVPWVLPSLIGVPAIVIWTSYYRRHFRHGLLGLSSLELGMEASSANGLALGWRAAGFKGEARCPLSAASAPDASVTPLNRAPGLRPRSSRRQRAWRRRTPARAPTRSARRGASAQHRAVAGHGANGHATYRHARPEAEVDIRDVAGDG